MKWNIECLTLNKKIKIMTEETQKAIRKLELNNKINTLNILVETKPHLNSYSVNCHKRIMVYIEENNFTTYLKNNYLPILVNKIRLDLNTFLFEKDIVDEEIDNWFTLLNGLQCILEDCGKN